MAEQPKRAPLRTLKKRRDFLALRKAPNCSKPGFLLAGQPRAEAVNTPTSTAVSATQTSDEPRIGYTVTKKLGNAVIRNRIRRRLREAVRLVGPTEARAGFDYVLIARTAALERRFEDLQKDLCSAFARVHGICDGTERAAPRPRRARRRAGRGGSGSGTGSPPTANGS